MSSHLTPPPQGFADPVARSQIAGILGGGLPVGTATALAAGATLADAVTGVAPASQALATTLAALGIRRRAITSTGSLAATDLGAVVDATSGTFALGAASSLGASFWCVVRNSGTGVVTFTPSGGAATIDGAATFALVGGESLLVYLDTVSAGAWISRPGAATSLVLAERTAPGAVADKAQLYTIDESGTTALRARFGTNDIRIAKDSAAAAYTITNDATDRTFDANATTIDELADIVATLLRDLAARTTFITAA